MRLRNAVRLNPAVGQGELSAGSAARADRQEGRSRPAARAVEDAATGGRSDVTAAAAVAGAGTMKDRCLAHSARRLYQRIGGIRADRRRRRGSPGQHRSGHQARPDQLERSTSSSASPSGSGTTSRARSRRSSRPSNGAAECRRPQLARRGPLGEIRSAGCDRRVQEGRSSSIRSTAAPTRTWDPRWRRAVTTIEAVTVFEQALTLEPNSVGAHMNLGLALREKGDLEGALTHLQRVADADPASASVQYELGHDAAAERRPARRDRRIREGARRSIPSCARATTASAPR